MVSVLIVDDDAHICRALTRALNAHGFESTAARGYDEAVERLADRHYDVLLTDLRMGEKDGIALLSKLRESNYRSRPILMSAYASALESQRALELGAVRVLCKPLETRDVVEAIQRAADASSTYFGQVHGISLIDLLQVFHYGQRTLALELLGTPPSIISMKQGQIVDVRHGDEEGEPALRTILRQPAGPLRTKALGEFTPTVQREFQALLLDLLRELDEESRAGTPASASSLPAHAAASDPSSLGGDAFQSYPAPTNSAPPLGRGLAARPELDAACARVVSMVDRSRYCELLDLRTGHLLGSHHKAPGTSPVERQLAQWATQLYRELPRPAGAGPDAAPVGAFDEIQVSTADTFHFAKALLPGIVVLAATERSGGVGLAWSQLRAALLSIERDVREHLLPVLTSLT